MREMPGMEWRVLAMISFTLKPGSCPPSPGFAPWAILICISSALTRYSVVTPKRPDATCLMAERSDGAVFARGEAGSVFATFARVAPAVYAVHGEGKGLVLLLG